MALFGAQSSETVDEAVNADADGPPTEDKEATQASSKIKRRPGAESALAVAKVCTGRAACVDSCMPLMPYVGLVHAMDAFP